MEAPRRRPTSSRHTRPISATRAPGFAEEIVLNPPAGLPANVPLFKLASIAKGKDQVQFKLDVNAKTPLGEYFVFLSGKATTVAKGQLVVGEDRL